MTTYFPQSWKNPFMVSTCSVCRLFTFSLSEKKRKKGKSKDTFHNDGIKRGGSDKFRVNTYVPCHRGLSWGSWSAESKLTTASAFSPLPFSASSKHASHHIPNPTMYVFQHTKRRRYPYYFIKMDPRGGSRPGGRAVECAVGQNVFWGRIPCAFHEITHAGRMPCREQTEEKSIKR